MRKTTSRTLAFTMGERNIFFHILTGCNLACRHCYINPAQHGRERLPLTVIENWLKLFYDSSRRNNVIFLGGEPTLHPDLAAAVGSAKKLGYATITIDTNGFLHHNILDKISPRDAVMSFSLDGPTASVNDAIRGKDVFTTCTENIKKAIAKGFEVSVIYTVSRLNIKHLHLMPQLLADLGVHRFFIQVIGLRGNSAEAEQSLQLSPSEWLATIPQVAAKAAQLGMEVIYPKVFLEPSEDFECAGNVAENFFIFPNGRVYRCPLCEDFPVNSYDIVDNKLVKKKGLTEDRFFSLAIAEGCVMNKLLQPDNIDYDSEGKPVHRISCCLLKTKITPDNES